MTDEEQIREMQALWGQRDSERDFDGWSQLYTEDGKYINPRGQEFVGRAALKQNIADRYASRPEGQRTVHVFGPPIVRVHGDVAESATDYVVLLRENNTTTPGATGRHYARLVRRGSGWLFTEYRIINVPDDLPPAPR